MSRGVRDDIETLRAREVESTATLTFTRDCTLCGGDIHVVNGERQRHACRIKP